VIVVCTYVLTAHHDGRDTTGDSPSLVTEFTTVTDDEEDG